MTMDFFPTIDVTGNEAEAIARGLYTVAAVDGVHERELALIADFSRTTTTEGDGAGAPASSAGGGFGALGRIAPLEPASLAPLLPGSSLRELFMKAAYLVAWADGAVSPAERAKIAEFAQALGVSAAAVASLEAQVKDYLLRPLAHLANVEAVAAVAKKLGA
jgi:tellurite resistance protein